MTDSNAPRECTFAQALGEIRQMNQDIYQPEFVKSLFNEMSATYGFTNYVSSFGFTERWRRACVAGVPLTKNMLVVDLMTGMGETWSLIAPRLGQGGQIRALDIAPEMCRVARERTHRFAGVAIDVIEGDALAAPYANASADCVISSFGLKTFSSSQLVRLAAEVWRIVKPGGAVCFVEISVPKNALLRLLFMFYLQCVIPIVGRLCLGNPANYRCLARYTVSYRDGAAAVEALEGAGFAVERDDLFFGCATRIRAVKPTRAS